MVNVFGQSDAVGKKGDKGDTGDSGFSIIFFSKQLLKWFNEILILSFYFDTETSGILIEDEKRVGIKNQVTNKNAKALTHVGSMSKIDISGKYALEFKNTVYKVENIDWAFSNTQKSILIFAFKVPTFVTNKQYIFHTMNKDEINRAVYIENADLVIQTSSLTKVPYRSDSWNICYIEYGKESNYWINENTGTFQTIHIVETDYNLLIGGKDENTFNGIIARIDFYSERHVHEGFLPVGIRDIIIESYKALIPYD